MLDEHDVGQNSVKCTGYCDVGDHYELDFAL
jgi:hypothetical protein